MKQTRLQTARTADPALSEATLRRLKQAAKDASQHAYAPYSEFRVGAAVLTEDGRTFTGANVENASFGLTICAERNAVFQAVAKGARRIRAVVIYTPTRTPTPPCGACRQVMREFGEAIDVCSTCDGPDDACHTLAALLPAAFGPERL